MNFFKKFKSFLDRFEAFLARPRNASQRKTPRAKMPVKDSFGPGTLPAPSLASRAFPFGPQLLFLFRHFCNGVKRIFIVAPLSGATQQVFKLINLKFKSLNSNFKFQISNYLKLGLIVALICGVGLFLYSHLQKSTYAAWFDDKFAYRQTITVTNPSLISSVTDYQLSFTLDTATLITAGKMQTSCNDIRITDYNGKTLPYWVEESGTGACNLGTTKIWVKYTVPPGTSSLLLYYGNPGALSSSNGPAVFDFFDNFNKNVVDKSLWTLSGSSSWAAPGSLSLTNASIISRSTFLNQTVGFRAKTNSILPTGIANIGFNQASVLIGPEEAHYTAVAGTAASLISMHKLEETTSTDANQFKPSGYFDTGKLGQAVSVYGNAAGTTGSTLTFNLGKQISGNNYEHFNPNQGTVSLWFKPNWNGNPSTSRFLSWLGGRVNVYIDVNGTLTGMYSDSGWVNRVAHITGTSWSSSTWYHIVFQWNGNSVVSGSQYVAIILNGTASTDGYASSFVAGAPSPVMGGIGFNSAGVTQSQGLIDDFAIFDRVLTTAEIATLYGNGTTTMVEAGSVADPSLKFYAKMDGSGTLAPVTYNAGASASKLTAKSTELTGGVNLLADGLMELSGITNWTAHNATVTKTTTAANIQADTQALSIASTSSPGWASQTLTVTGNTNYHLSGWMQSDGTNQANIQAYDNTNYANITYSTYVTSSTWTRVDFDFKTPANTTSLIINLIGTITGATYYFDNISLVPNLVDNGGMEGGDPPTSWQVQAGNPTGTTLSQSNVQAHSGTYSLKALNADSIANPVVGTWQAPTITLGTKYLISAWVHGGGSMTGRTVTLKAYDATTGYQSLMSVTLTNSWQKLTGIAQFGQIASNTSVRIHGSAAAQNDFFYVDDVSVVALDNVATSFQAWAPVIDSGTAANNLSVQGALTGVSSGTGKRGNGYTFDGSTGYLRQKTYATNIGTLSYGTNQITDTGQTFTTYKSSNPAAYMIVVTNSDNTTSWGYIGSTGTATQADIFTTKALAVAGWNGTAVSGKTPIGYEIRKTDYQITGSLTVGAWVKPAASMSDNYILSKSSSGTYQLRAVTDGGGYRFYAAQGGDSGYSTTPATVGVWAYVVGVYDGSRVYIYVNGVLQNSGVSYGAPTDVKDAFIVGARDYPGSGIGNYFNGSIDSPFVINRALTNGEIQDLYNATLNYPLETTLSGSTAATPSATTIDTNYHNFEVTQNATNAVLQIDGGIATNSATNSPTAAQTVSFSNTDVSNAINVDWVYVRKYNGTPPTVGAPSGEEKGGAPVAYWKLDDGTGTNAQDSSPNNRDGTLSGATLPTWQTEDQCIAGKCLFFDGASSYVGAPAFLSASAGTVEFWMRPNSTAAGARPITDNGGYWYPEFSATDTFRFVINDGSTEITPTATITANKWWHVSAVWGDSGYIRLYINGSLIGSTPAGSISNVTNTIQIGGRASHYYKGFLDDVKIFNYARTAAQIKLDYNGRGVSKGASVGAGSSSPGGNNPAPTLSNGLVGYWKMEDTTDSSGNAVTLTNNGTTTFLAGKFGNAGFFDVNTKFLSTTTAITGVKTVAFWINPTTTTTYPIDLNGTQTITVSSGAITANGFTGATIYVNGVASSTLVAGSWQHVVITTNTGFNSGTMTIGKVSTNSMNGYLDDVRIYNRALSSTEVTQLYNFNPSAVSRWNFEEGAGITAKDSGGAQNDATLQSGLLSALYPIWSPGKYGRGLSFNGIDQYLTAADSNTLDQNGSFSLSAYIKKLGDGVVAAKGTNYKLSIENGRSAFTTNAITTQLSGTAINDVYFYDTTKDTNYGDGTAADPLVWRFDSTKSWYSEAKDHTYAACAVATDDRCGNSEFPEKSYIVTVGTTTNGKVYIFDAQENAMWMRFDQGNTNMLITAQTTVTATYALNGKIYATSANQGLVAANFVGDSARVYQTGGYYNYGSTISNRNAGSGWTLVGAPAIVNNNVNDVHAAVISGKTYVAVATYGGGVSVINETDSVVTNFINTVASGYYNYFYKVFISGSDLYATWGNNDLAAPGVYLSSWYAFPTNYPSGASANFFTTSRSYTYSSSYATRTNPSLVNYRTAGIASLFVTQGTSTVDGTSNTIYVGLSVYNGSAGAAVVQEKKGDEANGSVKYFTNSYITEEMVGDIRGMWPFNGSGAIANTTDIDNAAPDPTSTNNARTLMTASNANGTGMTYATGVRGTGITFDGTDDYLKQKVYYDQTGATFGPTVHGLSLAATQAFYRAQGRDLSTYHGTDASSTPYMLVLKDSALKTAWGYVGSTDAAETLGTDLVTNGNMELDSNWASTGSPVTNERSTEQVNGGTYSRKVVTDGARAEGIQQTTSTLTIGKLYKLSYWVYKTGNASIYTDFAGTTYTLAGSNNVWQQKVIYRTSPASGTVLVDFYTDVGSSNTFYVDDVSVKEVTDVGTDGVHIVSTRNGSTRNWANIETGFNYNDTAYTYEVRKTDFQITGNLTVGAWVKRAATGARQNIIAKSDGVPNGYILRYNADNTASFVTSAGPHAISSLTITDNNWHYLVGVLDTVGGTQKLYIDGVVVGTATPTSVVGDISTAFMIGKRDATGDFMNGTIDEPFVTASALTADEIKNMYNVGKKALTAAGTNTLNGSSNQVNAVVAGGLSRRVDSVGANHDSPLRLYAGTAGGSVSEIDLSSDTLVNVATLNSTTVNALTYTTDGNYVAGLDSGFSRLNGVSGKSNLPSSPNWTNIVGSFDKNTGYYNLFENGILVGQTNVSTTHSPTTNASVFTVGSTLGSTPTHFAYPFYGSIDQVELYSYPLSTAAQNSLVSKPVGADPRVRPSAVGYWKFDEGTGTIANNSGSGKNSLNGTITGGTWSQSGKYNKAISFNGTSTVVSIPGSNNVQTISMWVNPTTTTQPLITLATGKSVSATAGTVVGAGFSSPTVYVNGKLNGLITANVWNHVLVEDTAAIYSNAITIGKATTYFSGLIDEVKFFDYALTVDEVHTEYNRGVALQMGSNSTPYCVPGDPTSCAAPVGEWNFEEGTGTSVADTSGNGNLGTWAGTGATHWTPGKIGTAGKFNGSDDRVDVGADSSLNILGDMSIETWIKPSSISSGERVIFGKGAWNQDGYFLERVGGILRFYTCQSGASQNTDTGSILTANNWYHVVVKRSGTSAKIFVNGVDSTTTPGSHQNPATSSRNAKIGMYSGGSLYYFDGLIDQVRIFNYARTGAQVAWDYNRGGPVASYNFDECSGNILHDRSGSGNNGTLTNMTTGDCGTNASTAWYNGRNGKFNSSLSFDGSDDFVSVVNSSSLSVGGTFSISAWVYPTTLAGRYAIFSTRKTNPAGGWQLEVGTGLGTNRVSVSGSGTWIFDSVNNVIGTNNWYHLVYVRTSNSDTGTLYVNGKAVSSSSTAAYTISDNTDAKEIGRGTSQTQNFAGQIDETQIYNYALTATQVKTLFNQNAAVRFGP